jgi:hypothetical protein
MLWDDLSGRLVVIDLEDVKWLKRCRALEPMSGNTRRARARAMKYNPGLERVYILLLVGSRIFVDSSLSEVRASEGITIFIFRNLLYRGLIRYTIEINIY